MQTNNNNNTSNSLHVMHASLTMFRLYLWRSWMELQWGSSMCLFVMHLHCPQHHYIHFLSQPYPFILPYRNILAKCPPYHPVSNYKSGTLFYKVGQHIFRLQKKWCYSTRILVWHKELTMQSVHHTNMMVHPKSCVVPTSYMGKDCNDGIHTLQQSG